MTDRHADVDKLLPSAQAGSTTAIGQVFEIYRDYLLAIANQRLDDALRAKGGASDIVQETFLEAQRDFAQFGGSTAAELKAWLVRLLVNNAANFARTYKGTSKRQIDREVGLPQHTPTGPAGGNVAGDTPTPSVEMMANERALALQTAIAKLPEDYRQIIKLRNQEDRPFDEVATLMNRSENAVRKLWFRAIEQLQKEMDEQP